MDDDRREVTWNKGEKPKPPFPYTAAAAAVADFGLSVRSRGIGCRIMMIAVLSADKSFTVRLAKRAGRQAKLDTCKNGMAEAPAALPTAPSPRDCRYERAKNMDLVFFSTMYAYCCFGSGLSEEFIKVSLRQSARQSCHSAKRQCLCSALPIRSRYQ